ncbi:MAG TPA: phosphate acetyltransferase [Ignavibacteria bacterium]
MEFKERIISNAKKHFKRIVLPESFEERTIKAAEELIKNEIADIILIGNREDVLKFAAKNNLSNIEKANIIDSTSFDMKEEYAEKMAEMRKSKGLTKEDAMKLLDNPLYLATMLIKFGEADGEVAGAMNATGDVLRPAFQFVKTQPGISVVSGAFFMLLNDVNFGENGILVFADCAVHPNPNEKELAEIALCSAKTARVIGGFEPRVAMLSFSTKGSAKHEMCDKVINATKIAKEMEPGLKIDGELQADAAIIESIGKKKCPDSKIAGRANVLIFPDLQSGNISYKLVQRLAGAEAIGPVLQGMAAPINDLSRGCSVEDIVYLAAITAGQATGN